MSDEEIKAWGQLGAAANSAPAAPDCQPTDKVKVIVDTISVFAAGFAAGGLTFTQLRDMAEQDDDDE